ncbi:MAG: MurR/RpiR family transcriptional regulator [Oscillospiraceae bacterium]|nr:MurR/RpiR family transcriptional regulator [Oscillospiraceae bacterium]
MFILNKDFLHKISENMHSFSKGQKRIGNFILSHYDKAAFMTAAKLGESVGVSESTVVRFASELGYDGYPELQHALQEMIRNRLTTVQRIEITSDRMSNSDVLTKILNMDIEKIRRTLEDTSSEEFNKVADTIVSAKHIYILGVRSSASLASFLSFYFYKIFDNVRNVATSSTSEVFEQIMNIGEGDVFIAITFPRYSKRTIKAAKYAHDKGATVIALTDSHSAPIIEYSDRVLLARSDMASFADSLVAPLSLINALIVAIGIRRRNEISATFNQLERIWSEYEVYEKSDDNENL